MEKTGVKEERLKERRGWVEREEGTSTTRCDKLRPYNDQNTKKPRNRSPK